MAHGVLIPEMIAAMNIDSYNRSVIDTGTSASPLDNGWVMVIDQGGKHTSGSLTEVWEISRPVTGSLSGLWMAYSGDEVITTDSKYKGLDPDPRNFFNVQNKAFSAFKPKVGDLILATADCFSGTKSSNTYVNATTAVWTLEWGATQTAAVQSWKLIGTTYISLASGGIDTQRVTAYELECVAE